MAVIVMLLLPVCVVTVPIPPVLSASIIPAMPVALIVPVRLVVVIDVIAL